MRILNTDNFGGDYPNERFELFPMSKESAQKIVDILNKEVSVMHPRYWKVVEDDYKLQHGFEP